MQKVRRSKLLFKYSKFASPHIEYYFIRICRSEFQFRTGDYSFLREDNFVVKKIVNLDPITKVFQISEEKEETIYIS